MAGPAACWFDRWFGPQDVRWNVSFSAESGSAAQRLLALSEALDGGRDAEPGPAQAQEGGGEAEAEAEAEADGGGRAGLEGDALEAASDAFLQARARPCPPCPAPLFTFTFTPAALQARHQPSSCRAGIRALPRCAARVVRATCACRAT